MAGTGLPASVISHARPNPANPPTGCYFHPRCPYVVDACRTEAPALREVDGHFVRCHRAEELTLTGA